MPLFLFSIFYLRKKAWNKAFHSLFYNTIKKILFKAFVLSDFPDILSDRTKKGIYHARIHYDPPGKSPQIFPRT